MRSTTLWARLLGLKDAVVEDVRFDEVEECVAVSVRVPQATKRRCGRCCCPPRSMRMGASWLVGTGWCSWWRGRCDVVWWSGCRHSAVTSVMAARVEDSSTMLRGVA